MQLAQRFRPHERRPRLPSPAFHAQVATSSTERCAVPAGPMTSGLSPFGYAVDAAVLFILL
jgi:hypothetical protein